jgi:hypothetical protein
MTRPCSQIDSNCAHVHGKCQYKFRKCRLTTRTSVFRKVENEEQVDLPVIAAKLNASGKYGAPARIIRPNRFITTRDYFSFETASLIANFNPRMDIEWTTTSSQQPSHIWLETMRLYVKMNGELGFLRGTHRIQCLNQYSKWNVRECLRSTTTFYMRKSSFVGKDATRRSRRGCSNCSKITSVEQS